MLFHVSRPVFAAVAVLLAFVMSAHAAGVQQREAQRPPRAVTTTSDLPTTTTYSQSRTLPTVSPPVSTLNGTVTTSTITDSSVSPTTSKFTPTTTTTRNQTTTTTPTTTPITTKTTSSSSSTTTSRKNGGTSLRSNIFFGTTTGLISMGLGALGVGIAFIAQATLTI